MSIMTRQRVLITGAGDSVGCVTAKTFLAAGAEVHVCDVNEQALAKTLAEIPALTGTVGSVGDRGDVDRIVAATVAAMGGIDVLVNFVGVAGPLALLEEISDEDWQASMQVNVAGMFYTMRAVVPGMKEQRSGAIVNISSASTRSGMTGRTPYVVSKCAVEGLTRNAARELGPFNVRCNAVLPGVLRNARMDFVIERAARARGITSADYEAEFLRYSSMRTRIDMQEIGDMVVFLCSDRAPHVTGQLIEVSGGHEWEE
jgi:NAD(P)-dependent dehydrogenase (short-subunit alcohol dehydrogenase family)